MFGNKKEATVGDVIVGIGLIVFSGIGIAATAIAGVRHGKEVVEFTKNQATKLNEKKTEVINNFKEKRETKNKIEIAVEKGLEGIEADTTNQ